MAYIGPTSVVQLVLPPPMDGTIVRVTLVNATEGIVGSFGRVIVQDDPEACATYIVEQESSGTCVCVCVSSVVCRVCIV